MSTKEQSRESFHASRKFYDDKNYPRGMSRSGDYSIAEVNIIETYGVALSGIASGTIEPITPEEIQFKAVCEGKMEPTTEIEKAWRKYQNKTLSPRQFHTLFGGSKVANEAEDTSPEQDTDIIDID